MDRHPEPAWDDVRTFFLAPDAWHEPYRLNADETHHLSKVLRIHPGEEIRVLDGHGKEGRFLVKKCERQSTDLHYIESWMHPKPRTRVILAAAWTKAARRSFFLEKAVEFEAEGVWIWQAERSQFPMPAGIKESWQKQCIAGAKQCRNPWLPDLRTFPGGLNELLAAAATLENQEGRLFRRVLVESGTALPLAPDALAQEGAGICVVGPEGGFAPQELDCLKKAAFQPITLGRRVLRWETAAMICLGLYWWRRSLPDIVE